MGYFHVKASHWWIFRGIVLSTDPHDGSAIDVNVIMLTGCQQVEEIHAKGGIFNHGNNYHAFLYPYLGSSTD